LTVLVEVDWGWCNRKANPLEGYYNWAENTGRSNNLEWEWKKSSKKEEYDGWGNAFNWYCSMKGISGVSCIML